MKIIGENDLPAAYLLLPTSHDMTILCLRLYFHFTRGVLKYFLVCSTDYDYLIIKLKREKFSQQEIVMLCCVLAAVKL